MKIYTKTGDEGTTGLLDGTRLDKDSLRVEAYGGIDEISSALGMARAAVKCGEVKESIYQVQKLLMLVMAELAGGEGYVKSEHINLLEEQIDCFDDKLPPLQHFIIPGDTPGAAFLDHARTVTRRAERAVWRLGKSEPVNKDVLLVLNRLSDLCFVLSRIESE